MSEALGKLYLNDVGQLVIADDEFSQSEVEMSEPPVHLLDNFQSTSLSIVPSTGRKAGKKLKASAPMTTKGFRRGLRSDKDGYVEQALPNQPSRRKSSQVPLAQTPAILQIIEMQKIGVEKCEVDPEDPTEEKLLCPCNA